ncbi:MAG: hypothetical protein ACK5HO_00245 [Pseudomonadota bacterium]|jgi:hypothetical protein
MFESIKANIFTIHGILTTLIHVFLVVGFMTCWVAFQVQFMGNRPTTFWSNQPAPHPTPEKGKK